MNAYMKYSTHSYSFHTSKRTLPSERNAVENSSLINLTLLVCPLPLIPLYTHKTFIVTTTSNCQRSGIIFILREDRLCANCFYGIIRILGFLGLVGLSRLSSLVSLALLGLFWIFELLRRMKAPIKLVMTAVPSQVYTKYDQRQTSSLL